MSRGLGDVYKRQLCCQARPDITPAEFIELIKDTVQAVQPSSGGRVNVIDPEAVIARLTG